MIRDQWGNKRVQNEIIPDLYYVLIFQTLGLNHRVWPDTVLGVETGISAVSSIVLSTQHLRPRLVIAL